MYDGINYAHLKIGHKNEKAMEVKIKKKYSNITRDLIKIFKLVPVLCIKESKIKRSCGKTSGYVYS